MHNEPTHDEDEKSFSLWQEPEDHSGEEIDASAGYETTDIKVTGIVVFLGALAIFVCVTAVLCYGIGWVFFNQLAKQDKADYGPRSKWAKTVDVSPLGNLATNPELQNKLAATTEQFPTPRLQTDDGYQEIADLHQREELLLDHYSYVDKAQGKVRIPIERAMELIAQQGLPVAPAAEARPLLTGEVKPVVTAPLTNGFTRTGYEYDEAVVQAAAAKREGK
jgi:hypothetical protein